MIDHRFDALREALAAEPTGGDWRHRRHADVMIGNRRLCNVNAGAKLGVMEDVKRAEVNARYIAACNPETIAALLAALDEALDYGEHCNRLIAAYKDLLKETS